MGLRSLRISSTAVHNHRGHLSYDSLSSAANSSTDSSDTDDRCDSSLGLEDDKEFPVEILPYLFLGNASNSEDSQALARHNIQVYIYLKTFFIYNYIFKIIFYVYIKFVLFFSVYIKCNP